MAMDPIQQSPFVYYPQVAATGGDIGKSFSSGYTAEQQHAANALAMDAARQTEIMNQQSMRLKETEEARKQALFKQGMAERARVAALAARPLDTSLPGGSPAAGAPSGGGDNVLPPTTQPFAGGVSAGTENYRSAPAAPAAPAPGPRAEYEPSSQKPDWYNPQPRVAGLTGPQFAQNTTQANDAQAGGYAATRPAATPVVNPYGEVNPNASAFTQDVQGLKQSANIGMAFNSIEASLRRQAGGAVGNYFTGTPQSTAVRENAIAAYNWYRSPEGQALLRANPQLLQAAENDPLGVFNSRYSLPEYLGKYGRQDGAQSTAPMESNYTDTVPRQFTSEQKRTPYEENFSQTIINIPPAKPGATEGGVNTNKNVADNITESKSVQPAINLQGAFEGFNTVMENRKLDVAIASYKKQYDMAMKARDFATARDIQIKTTEAVLAKEQLGYMGLIHDFQNGNYAPLANALNAVSKQYGGDTKLQPRWDGKFNVFNKGELISEGVTKDQLILLSRQKFDSGYKEQIASLQKIELKAKEEAAITGARVPAATTTHALNAEADLRATVNKESVKHGYAVDLKRMEFLNEAEKAAAKAAADRSLKQYESTLPRGQKIMESKEMPGVFIRYDEVGGGTKSAFKLVPKINPATNKPFMEADGKTPQVEMVEIGN